MTAAPKISVVVPLHNEEENVAPLVQAVRASLDGKFSWELILVDDHSRDGTIREVLLASRMDPRVRLIPLARQGGQSTAMQAGFDHARGEVFVTMDGDLQNDPRDIPSLIIEIEKGYDLVAGYREKRKDLLVTRKVPSWIANRIIAWSTGVPIRDNGCSLKAYRRELLTRMRLYSDMHRFIPALAAGTAGARITEIPVRHHPRLHGTSKYGLGRVGRVLVDLMTVKMIRSFRGNPLLMFGGLAAVSATLGVMSLALALRVQMGADSTSEPSVVFTGVGTVFVAQSLFLVMLGLVAQVAVSVNARRKGPRGAILHEVASRRGVDPNAPVPALPA
jgi:glycosyltransferase involved in cell wall biosynthesis